MLAGLANGTIWFRPVTPLARRDHLHIISAKSLRLNTLGGLRIEQLAPAKDSTPRARALALLAILAVAERKGTNRERILGILWPDSHPERARHALSQTLYALHRTVGVEIVTSSPDLALDPRHISTDLEVFRAAVVVKNWTAAGSLFAGPFLDGFYLADAPDFERWVETERAELTVVGVKAIEACAREHAAAGRPEAAADCWRRLTRLDPLHSRIAIEYMTMIAALGDRAGALSHGRAFVESLRRELGTGPDQAMQRALSQLRGEEAATPRPATMHITRDAPTEAAPPLLVSRPDTARGRSIAVLAGLALILVVGALSWRAIAAGAARSSAVIAVGRIRDLAIDDSVRMQSGSVLTEMLSTSLGRLDGLRVIANSRILELMPRDADTTSGAPSDAARRAGASEVLEGELMPLPNHQMRLEVRRVELSGGLVLGGYRITGTDRMALFDSLTVLIAMDVHVAAPTGSLAEVSTKSPTTYRLYEDGLRAFYQTDAYAANRLFRAAILEDSSFAMATYYAWRSAVAIQGPDQNALAARALALSSRASDHDRLLILTHVGFTREDIHASAAADSLVARFGNDPDALIRAAEVTSDLARAIVLLNRAIALDSVVGVGPIAVCRRCEALIQMESRFRWADSTVEVERTLRRWQSLRPADYAPWMAEADYWSVIGRRSVAQAARDRAASLGAPPNDPIETGLNWKLHADDVHAASTECHSRLANAGATDLETFRWWCTVLLRSQGRYREAVTLSRAIAPADSLRLAILDAESGRPLQAATFFAHRADALGKIAEWPAGIRARNMTWYLTLAATQFVAAGDTLRARSLVDSIERLGRESLFPRDPVLHHFVRGLLFARAANHAAAVPEFRAALVSPSNGYTRINYELGKSLLALRRPAEGIPVLRSVLHGGLDGAGLYLTRTEAHELLGQLFDAAGQADSAQAHYAIVERAWRSADAFLKPRYEAALRRASAR